MATLQSFAPPCVWTPATDPLNHDRIRPEQLPEKPFHVAETLSEIVAAWREVYEVYATGGLITPNPYGIHTYPQAVGEHAVVILDRNREMTLTSVHDSAMSLPLDSLYRAELNELRAQGRSLTEIGLFVDRRKEPARGFDALFTIMTPAVAWCFESGGTDVVIGVHPHHARFYIRAYGFETIGAERNYAAVNNRPCLLLRLRRETLDQARLPRGLAHYVQHPVFMHDFDRRADFVTDLELRTYLDSYLRHKAALRSALDRAA